MSPTLVQAISPDAHLPDSHANRPVQWIGISMSGGIPFGLEKVTTMSCGVTGLVPNSFPERYAAASSGARR